jgi:hypothetical protein
MKRFVTWYLDHSQFLTFLWCSLAILLVVLTRSWIALVGTLAIALLFFLGCDYLESKYSKAKNKKFMKATEPTYRWVRIGERAVQLPRDSGTQPKPAKEG